MTSDIQAELESIAAENGGITSPRAILERARDPENPLHLCFTWKDSEAAEKYRLVQARALARAYVTVRPANDGKPVRIRALISLPEDRATGGGYRRIDDVMKDEDMMASAINEIRREVMRLQIRFWAFASLQPALLKLKAALDILPDVERSDRPAA